MLPWPHIFRLSGCHCAKAVGWNDTTYRQVTLALLSWKSLTSYCITVWQPFCDITGTHPKGMPSMLKMLKLPHVGRHHSGIGMQFARSNTDFSDAM